MTSSDGGVSKREILSIVAVCVLVSMATSSVMSHISSSHDGHVESNMADVMGAVVAIECTDGSVTVAGTGFVISSGSLKIVTNAHVTTKTENGETKAYPKITARFYYSKEKYDLYSVSFDKERDISVLAFYDEPSCETLSLRDDYSEYGERVFGIGNAKGHGLAVVAGVVAVPLVIVANKGTERPSVVINAMIEEGDSGGPVVDTRGRVIGMMSFKLREDAGQPSGMGYAVPSQEINSFLKEIS
jgi:S1-C subfamily serine protease